VTLSESKSFDEFVETFRAAGSGKKRKKRGGGSTGFDIVHVALWRNHEWEDTLAVLRTATELLKDNGTLVVFRFVRCVVVKTVAGCPVPAFDVWRYVAGWVSGAGDG